MTTGIRSNADGSKSYIAVGGTDRVTIDAATGAVGIGAVPIGAKVESHSSASLNMRLVKTAVVDNDGPLLAFTNYNNSAGISDVAAIQSSLQSGTPGQEAADLTFLTKPIASGNIERLRIKSTGEVLVTNPAGLGYGPGAGGTVTQATNKSTPVTLNKPCGRINMHTGTLPANTLASFIVFNSTVSVTDVVVATHASGGDPASYEVRVTSIGTGSFVIRVKNVSTNALSESLVINFAIIKGATA